MRKLYDRLFKKTEKVVVKPPDIKIVVQNIVLGYFVPQYGPLV